MVDDEYIINTYEGDYEKNFMIKYWKCKYWEEVIDDKETQGLPYTYHYNLPHFLKPSVANTLNTVFQCILKCTTMNPYF